MCAGVGCHIGKRFCEGQWLLGGCLHIDVKRRGPGDRFPASALDAVMMMMLIDCIVEAGGIAEANTCSALLGRCL